MIASTSKLVQSSTSLLRTMRPRAAAAPGASRPARPPPPPSMPQGSGFSAAPEEAREHAQEFQQSKEDQSVRGGTSKTLWQSYLAINPRTRLVLGLSLAAFSLFGILVSDQLESIMPPSSPAEGQRGGNFMISVLERAPSNKQRYYSHSAENPLRAIDFVHRIYDVKPSRRQGVKSLRLSPGL